MRLENVTEFLRLTCNMFILYHSGRRATHASRGPCAIAWSKLLRSMHE
jgi:hypothetical protein